MKKIITILFFMACTLQAYTLNPTNELQKTVDKKILQGLDELHKGNYVSTLNVFRDVIALEPEHPAGYFYYAAALQWLISDYRNYKYRDIFLEHLEITIEKANAMLEKDENDSWAHFYYGGAYGFRGVYYSDNGNFFKGFRDGTKSYKSLKKAVQQNPEIYDAYYGIGLYDFYKAYYLEKFLWLGKETVTKEEGISGMWVSAERGKYAKIEAQMTLIRVYYENYQYGESTKIAEELLAKYPNYLFGLWFLARTYSDMGEDEKSYATYLAIKALLEKSIFKTKASFFEIDYQIAKYFASKGEAQKAYNIISKSLKTEDELDGKLKYVKKYLKYTKKLEKELRKELEK